MSEQRPELRVVDGEAPHCVHHWVLGDPAAGRILGRCRRCNANRVFSASLESTERFDDYRELTATRSYYVRDRQSA